MRILVIASMIFLVAGCKKYRGISDCINTKVEALKNSEILCRDASVKEYSFQGKLVYVFNAGNCLADGGADVYDSNCNYLGTVGGVTGNQKIDGVDFNSNASYRRLIWPNH